LLSPHLFEPEELRGGLAVVVDQLRASTTIAHALSAGAAAVLPCEEVGEAWTLAAANPGSLLGGERGGARIEGFDLGNSPGEFTPERVRGRTIVFTTTNGTRALQQCVAAERVVVGALANRSAVAASARASDLPTFLVCAGIEGAVCAEDVIAAGAIARAIVGGAGLLTDDGARLATQAWDRVAENPASLQRAMEESAGGRNLARIGLAGDIAVCCRVDAVNLAPQLDARGRLVVP
jgi:2-phosphosulfolactate phosphatase